MKERIENTKTPKKNGGKGQAKMEWKERNIEEKCSHIFRAQVKSRVNNNFTNFK